MKILYYNPFLNSPTGSRVHARSFLAIAKRVIEKENGSIKEYPTLIEERYLCKSGKNVKLPQWIKSMLLLIYNFTTALIRWPSFIRKAESFDTVIVRYMQFDFLPFWLMRRRNIPIILEVNSPQYYELVRFLKPNIWLRIFKTMEREFWDRATRIVTVSEEMRRFLVDNGVDESKIVIAANGVDLQLFTPQPNVNIKKSEVFKDKTVVCFTGSLKKWHGIDLLMKAIVEVRKQDPSVELLVIGGESDTFNSLRHTAGLKDGFVHIPNRPHNEIPPYLAQAQITVAPYPMLEFFYFSPLKLFEYMAMGKAIIASNIGQIAEVCTDGVNAMLIEPGNINQLKDAILVLKKNPALREKLGQNARSLAEKSFSWEINVRDILTECRKVVNER